MHVWVTFSSLISLHLIPCQALLYSQGNNLIFTRVVDITIYGARSPRSVRIRGPPGLHTTTTKFAFYSAAHAGSAKQHHAIACWKYFVVCYGSPFYGASFRCTVAELWPKYCRCTVGIGTGRPPHARESVSLMWAPMLGDSSQV